MTTKNCGTCHAVYPSGFAKCPFCTQGKPREEKSERRSNATPACQGCASSEPTEYVTFYWNAGAILFRFNGRTEGNPCQDCIRGVFMKYTTVNMLFGWWGALSFFYTFAYVWMNLIQYLRSGRRRGP